MPESTLPFVPLTPEIQSAVDDAVNRDRLRLLEIAYYISGAVTIVFVSFLLIHFTMLLILGLDPEIFTPPAASRHPVAPPPPGFFLIFAVVVGFIILLGWTFGGLQIYAGRCLKKRCHRLFILIVAGVECIFIPWGTPLGVCSFLVLDRPKIRLLFGQ